MGDISMTRRWSPPYTLAIAVLAAVAACSDGDDNARLDRNDRLFSQVVANTEGFEHIVSIDHARLAADAGVTTMPPAHVAIFNNRRVSSRLMQLDPMLGLELPYRVLAYAVGDESLLAYADQSFIRERHGIDDSVSLDDYENDVTMVTQLLDEKCDALVLSGEV